MDPDNLTSRPSPSTLPSHLSSSTQSPLRSAAKVLDRVGVRLVDQQTAEIIRGRRKVELGRDASLELGVPAVDDHVDHWLTGDVDVLDRDLEPVLGRFERGVGVHTGGCSIKVRRRSHHDDSGEIDEGCSGRSDERLESRVVFLLGGAVVTLRKANNNFSFRISTSNCWERDGRRHTWPWVNSRVILPKASARRFPAK